MAEWDYADCLSRCQRLAFRPGVDESMQETDWAAFMSEAQEYWLQQLAVHVPESQYGAPQQLTTPDGGFTYYFPNNVFPFGHIELRYSSQGRLLRPGTEFDPACDYVPEGDHIRFPMQKSKVFPQGGPWARFIPMPSALVAGGAVQPVIKPANARALIVFRACIFWASRGGYRDPKPYRDLETFAWSGDPEKPGDTGILGALKTQFLFSGAAAWPAGQSVDNWWRSVDDGSGYSAQVP